MLLAVMFTALLITSSATAEKPSNDGFRDVKFGTDISEVQKIYALEYLKNEGGTDLYLNHTILTFKFGSVDAGLTVFEFVEDKFAGVNFRITKTEHDMKSVAFMFLERFGEPTKMSDNHIAWYDKVTFMGATMVEQPNNILVSLVSIPLKAKAIEINARNIKESAKSAF